MRPKTKSIIPVEPVENLIRFIRGQRVILDADLARIYGAPTKVLNQAVKRNTQRFPSDFVFQLTPKEWKIVRAQSSDIVEANRSQIVTGSQAHRDPRFPPYAFTEHGAIMAANVLNGGQAVQMSVFVVRAFVKMRETLAAHRELTRKLEDLERNLTARLDNDERSLKYVLNELHKLRNPPEPPRRPIGFHVNERATRYRARSGKICRS